MLGIDFTRRKNRVYICRPTAVESWAEIPTSLVENKPETKLDLGHKQGGTRVITSA